jgi:predicted nucleotidyltransferase component of viral defense system
MQQCDLSKWVDQEENPLDRQFREAVHTVLIAVSYCRDFSIRMIMKGAVLLSIRYNCIRYTTDIDFSTSMKAAEFDKDKFLSDLNESLIRATETLDYGLDCRVQSCKFKPPSAYASFPTLKIKIGYAYKHDKRSHKKLLKRNSSKVLEIDYSFNEESYNVENISLKNGGTLLAYGFADLIAEKYRAILQQVVRNRNRRQDVYDLYYLFNQYNPQEIPDRRQILDSLVKKAAARDISVDRYSMRDPEIISCSRYEYDNLKAEIVGALPEFEKAYHCIQSFYENLPWNDSIFDGTQRKK